MALKMNVTSPHGPVSVNGYVKIQHVQVDNNRKVVRYQVAHYWDEQARLDGKGPFERHKVQMVLDEAPEAGVNILNECYEDLKTKDVPYDYTQATDVL